MLRGCHGIPQSCVYVWCFVSIVVPSPSSSPPHDCVTVLKSGDIHILRLLRMEADKIRVQQFNPAREKDMARKDIETIYAVIGRG